MPFFSFLKHDAGMADLIQHNPERMGILATLTEEIMHGEDSPLTIAQRELLAAYVSGINLCKFCHGAHKAFAEAQGVDYALFEQLMNDIDAAPVDGKMKTMLKFCRKLSKSPSRLTRADADAVFKAGWEEKALEDAIAVTALFNLYNRIADGYGLEGASHEYHLNRGFKIKEHGYDYRNRAYYISDKS